MKRVIALGVAAPFLALALTSAYVRYRPSSACPLVGRWEAVEHGVHVKRTFRTNHELVVEINPNVKGYAVTEYGTWALSGSHLDTNISTVTVQGPEPEEAAKITKFARHVDRRAVQSTIQFESADRAMVDAPRAVFEMTRR